jgi:ERCC4-type nuclease
MLHPLHIIIDSREQSPWSWLPSDATTEIAGLVSGDYALAQDTEEPKRKGMLRPVRFSLERKSLEDFLGTISSGWDRFVKELTRMDTFPARVVIVEGDFASCCFREEAGVLMSPDHSHCDLRPAFVARQISELTMMNVSVLMAGDAMLAAGLAYRIFRRRYEQCLQQ